MNKSRTLNSTKNIIAAYISYAINILLQFLSRTVFIYTLGVGYLSFNGLFSEVLKFLSLADLGLSSVMAYTFYKPLAEKDKNKLAALTNFYKKMYRFIALIVTIIGLFLIPFLDVIVNTEKPIPNLELYYLLFLTNTIISYLFIYKTTLLIADQRSYIIVKLKTKITFIITIIQMSLLLITNNYILYLIIMNISTLLQNLFPVIKVNKLYPYINQESTLSKKEYRAILENIKSVFIYKVASVCINSTDNILISILIGTVWVGYYSNYLLIVSSVTMFVTGIFTSMTASVGNLLVEESIEKRWKVFNSQQTISFIISGIVVPCFCLLINDFINIWLGEKFVLGILTVYAITLNFYLTCIFQPLWSFREASGLYRKTRYIMIFTALINLILSIYFAKIFGLAGIFFATAIAKLSTYFWYEPKILFKDYFHRSSSTFYKNILINIIFLICLIFLNGLVTNYLDISNWWIWVFKATIIGVLSLMLSVMFYSKSEGFKLIVSRLKMMRKIN